jgi:Domain of unknown function (DUF927)
VQAPIHAGLADTPTDCFEVSEVSAKPSITLIPGEKDRPKFVVLDDWHNENGFNYRPGVWSFGIKHGRGDAPATLTQQWICSPLPLDAVTTDAHAGNYGRLLRIKTTLGKWLTWAMPMAMLRGDCSDLRGELLGMGVEIDPYGRILLAVYLQDRSPKRRIECALQTGWAGIDYKAFVLPDAVIGPRAASVAYQSGERGSDEYAVAGTLAGWQAGIAAMAGASSAPAARVRRARWLGFAAACSRPASDPSPPRWPKEGIGSKPGSRCAYSTCPRNAGMAHGTTCTSTPAAPNFLMPSNAPL